MPLRLAPEGTRIIAGSVILAVAFAGTGVAMGGPGLWLVAPGVLVPAATLWFFRDPERVPPSDAGNLLLAPADGTVTSIVREWEPLYLEGEALRISIYLSLLDVHVNRVPASGTVEHVRYAPGRFRAAFRTKASLDNERSEFGLVRTGGERIVFRQIAGAIARRIVFHLAEGERVAAGQRFGIITFGSRMDVLVPATTDVTAQVGQKAVAGETVLGRFRPAAVVSPAVSDDETVRDGSSC